MFKKLDLLELSSNPYEVDVVLSRQVYDATDVALSYYKRIKEMICKNNVHMEYLCNVSKQVELAEIWDDCGKYDSKTILKPGQFFVGEYLDDVPNVKHTYFHCRDLD